MQVGWPEQSRADVAVVGAGVIGACVARELTLAGRDVTVLESGSGWAAACSWGNAGFICPSHAGTWASRQDIAQGIRWLLRPDSPLGLRPRPALLRFLAWMMTQPQESVERATRVSRELCVDGLAAHARLGAELGTGFVQAGMMDVYASEAGFGRGARATEAHRAAGVRCEVLDAAGVAAAEPALGADVAGGVLFPDEAHCEPAQFVERVGGDAERRGARLRTDTAVYSVRPHGRGVELLTASGAITAQQVVVAAGAWSGQVLGRRLMLEGGKGYAIDCTAPDESTLRRPLILQEARVAVTPLTGRVRFAGTMQLDGLDTRVDPVRVAAVRRGATALLPQLGQAAVQRVWSGLRPVTPDGLPLIGHVGDPRVVVATGHAMLGLTQAVPTAVLVRRLLEGDQDDTVRAVRPNRFRLTERARRTG